MIHEKPQVTDRKRAKKGGNGVGKWGKIRHGLPVVRAENRIDFGPHGVSFTWQIGPGGVGKAKSLELRSRVRAELHPEPDEGA